MDEKKPETPRDYAAKWDREIAYAKKKFEKFHDRGDKVDKAYKDERDAVESGGTRLNLFHANVVTLSSMLYGRTPKVDVDRKYADPADDVARVSSEMLTRILNADIEEEGDSTSEVLRYCLDDRLLPGLGSARVRYDFESVQHEIAEMKDELGNVTAEGYVQEEITDEWVDTVYVHWKDILWSPVRVWSEVRWIAFRSFLTQEELDERFPETSKGVPMNSKSPLDQDSKSELWCKAEVWEIWCKDSKKVYWYVEGHEKLLDSKDPPTQHEGFFPMPKPMMANVTTSNLMPTPDYYLAQDLYLEIDDLQARIVSLTEACKLVGVYDKKNDGIKRMLTEGVENELIPVENWAMFAEKGGLKGVVDWLPLESVVKAIQILTEKQAERINQLYQVTGMSDILRGQAVAGASATEQALKAKFASVRVQALQDEFARFATDLQKLKYEIIAKQFQPELIIKSSNILQTPDAQYAPQAVEFIKNPEMAKWRISVQPETLAMVDFSQLRQERTEYIQALGLFLQSSAPIAEKFPVASPVLLELLKWGLAGFKGSRQIEGVLDKAVAAIMKGLQEQQQNPQPNPEMEKMKAEMQMQQQEHQMKMQQMQADVAIQQQKASIELKKMFEEFALATQKMHMEAKADAAKIQRDEEHEVFQNTMAERAAAREAKEESSES